MNKPRRRWFQVSLKTLFWLTLIIAAFFAGYGVAERRAEKELERARVEGEAAIQAALQDAERARMVEIYARVEAAEQAAFDAMDRLRKK
jgi:hypothetical protein